MTGPVKIYNKDTYLLESITYYDLGSRKLHREDGPAWTWFREDGSLWFESFYVKGKPHREEGPAILEYDSEGLVSKVEFYLRGEKMNFWTFFTVSTLENQKSLLKNWLCYV